MRHLILLLVLASTTFAIAAHAFPYQGWQRGPWEKVKTRDQITLYRNAEVDDVHAYRADIVLDAPPAVVLKLVLDHDRARSRSFVRAYDVLADDGKKTLVYMQVRRVGLGTREFTAAGDIFHATSSSRSSGFRFRIVAGRDDPKLNEFAKMEGSFVLTPKSGGKRTLLSYRILADPGTWIPDFVLRRALSSSAIEVVERLRADVDETV